MLSSLEDSFHIVSHISVFVNMFFCFSFEIFSAGLSAQPLSSDSFAIITNHAPFVNTFFQISFHFFLFLLFPAFWRDISCPMTQTTGKGDTLMKKDPATLHAWGKTLWRCSVLLLLYAALVLMVASSSQQSVFFPKNAEEAVETLSKLGSKGTEVTKIQTRLKEWGYYTGNVDGIYGEKTRQAVILFQKRNGLTPDGIAGPKRWLPLAYRRLRPLPRLPRVGMADTARRK